MNHPMPWHHDSWALYIPESSNGAGVAIQPKFLIKPENHLTKWISGYSQRVELTLARNNQLSSHKPSSGVFSFTRNCMWPQDHQMLTTMGCLDVTCCTLLYSVTFWWLFLHFLEFSYTLLHVVTRDCILLCVITYIVKCCHTVICRWRLLHVASIILLDVITYCRMLSHVVACCRMLSHVVACCRLASRMVVHN